MTLSFLDLAGVLLIGVVGAISVTAVQSQPMPAPISRVVEMFGLGGLSDQQLIAAIALTAAALLLLKSILSSLLSRRMLTFLANRQALVSARLAKSLLSRPLTFVQQRSSQETAFALITGAGAATMQLLGHAAIVASEAALLVVLGGALLLISPLIAIGSIVFFAFVALALQRLLGRAASNAGEEMSRTDIASFGAIQEALGAYREIFVLHRRSFYVHRVQQLRWRAARVSASWQFTTMVPKYVLEAALVVGAAALAGILFATSDAVSAVGTMALFLAAGSRIMPSILRMQTASLGLRNAAGTARPTLDLAADLENPQDDPEAQTAADLIRVRLQTGFPDFRPEVELRGVTFAYPGATTPAVSEITLSVPAGESLALVGRSGSGKSTLVDLILGVLDPDQGSIRIGGEPPQECVQRWPGAVSYVPQEVAIVGGTVRENVALGLPREATDDDMIWEALSRVQLSDHLKTERSGLETELGERGLRLSGGQRQRLGIARALYNRPRLLVLDESTSALDAESESAISDMLKRLAGQVTVVLVAHRLSTLRDIDRLLYLADGQAVALDSFEGMVQRVPDFKRQARLLGLA